MEQDYLIAGHRIRVEGDRLVAAIGALTGFTPFKMEADGEPLCHRDTRVQGNTVYK